MVKVYICYSSKDRPYKDELVKHLESIKQAKSWIEVFHDNKIQPGADTENELRKQMASSQVIFFLLSGDFVGSKFGFDMETRLAMDLRRHNRSIVVPILVKATNFAALPFSRLQAVPKDEGPVAYAQDRNKAWEQVIREITPLLKGIHQGEIELRRDSADDMLRPRNAKPYAKDIDEAKHQLAEGDIEDALDVLQRVSREVDKDLHLRVVLLAGQYKSWDHSKARGILSDSEIPNLKAGITNKLLGLIDELNTPDKYGPVARVH